MIGFLEKPTGRMGNVLIQYMFLRQLAVKMNTDYYHVELPYREYFDDFQKHNITIKLLFSKKWVIDNETINLLGIDKFIEYAKEKEKRGYNIVLKPPVLGHLFDFKDSNPAVFVCIKDKYKNVAFEDDKIAVGVHFRGTDFAEWNEKASLCSSYYIEALSQIGNILGKDTYKVHLFTDDIKFETYVETVEYLNKNEIDYQEESRQSSFIRDFVLLSQCDYMVSSPSTFAIVAGVLGKENKKIIHNKSWVDYCVENDENFWVDIKESNLSYYHIMSLV